MNIFKKMFGKKERSFDASKLQGTNTFNIASNRVQMNHELYNQLDKIKSASRQASQNDATFNRYLKVIRQNVVGADGFQFQSKQEVKGIINSSLNKEIEKHWKNFSKSVDVTNTMTLTEACYLALNTLAIDGECFIRIVNNYNNDYEFAIQFIDSQSVLRSYNNESLNIRMGIQYDEFNVPIKYFVSKNMAGSSTMSLDNVTPFYEIDANEIYHIFIKDYVGQTRGIPFASSVLVDMHNKKEFLINAAVNAAIGASKMAVITASEDAIIDEDVSFDDQNGSIMRLRPGEDLKTFDTKFPDDINPFVKAITRSIAMGLNVSSHTLSGDLESVNYSSARVGLIEDREHFKILQNVLIRQFLNKLYKDFMKQQLLTKKIKGLNTSILDNLSFEFLAKGFAWVDPLKEIEAQMLALQSGLKSFSDVAAENGYDRDELIAKIVDDKSALEAAGLTLNLNSKDKSNTIDTNKG